MSDAADQRITFLLQEIDANICAAHRSGTQILSTVRRHHQILRRIHEAAQVWQPLFDSFAVQPAAASPRRLTRTPAPISTARSTARLSPLTRQIHPMDDTVRDLTFSDDDGDPDVDDDEPRFKTITLMPMVHDSIAESINTSINSEIPPTIKHSDVHETNGLDKPVGLSTISENSSILTPTIQPPPRMSLLGIQRAPSPPSAISSIAPASPPITRNLHLSAFDESPPAIHKGTPPPQHAQSVVSPTIPVLPSVTITLASPQSDLMPPTTEEESKSESPFRGSITRKRPRSASPKERTSHQAVNNRDTAHTSPFDSSPSPFASRRSRYSTASEYVTPRRSRGPSMSVESIKKTIQDMVRANDSPETPPFDVPTPLLHTKLKAMTPHTPLSNRLVGADLECGSTAQEARYNQLINDGDPVPEFSLDLFPSTYQRGLNAIQLSTVYHKFQGIHNDSPALSDDQLAEMLPDYGHERIQKLLDLLVSRRLLRPFTVNGTMFWQKPMI